MGPALLDVSLATDTAVDHAQDVIKRVADSVWNDSDWRGEILEEPEVWGSRSRPRCDRHPPGGEDQAVRAVHVMRELRRRLLEAFASRVSSCPIPRVVWVEREAGTSQESEPTPE